MERALWFAYTRTTARTDAVVNGATGLNGLVHPTGERRHRPEEEVGEKELRNTFEDPEKE